MKPVGWTAGAVSPQTACLLLHRDIVGRQPYCLCDVSSMPEQNALVGSRLSRARDTQYQWFFEHSPLPAWIVDLETGRFLCVNDAALHRYGYSRDQLLAMTIADIQVQQVISETVTLAGHPAVLTLVVDHGGDDTLRPLQVERTLAESERHYRALVDNASDIITVLTVDGMIQYMSPSVQRLLGYGMGELLGRRAFELVHPDDAAIVSGAMQRALAGSGGRIPVEFRFRHGDGSWRVLESIGHASAGPTGVTTIIVNSRDVTDRTVAEEKQQSLVLELRAARLAADTATRAKSEFLASMSHEIRTPMHAVLGLTELILDSTLTAEQRRYLEMVRDSGDVLLALLNDILDLSKIEADRVELEAIPLDLDGLIRSTVNLFAVAAPDRAVAFLVHIGPDVPRFVQGDPTRLRQILMNLLGNAVKFTPQGEIVVSATLDGLENDQAVVRLAVRDTGIGIPREKIATLFREYSQLDATTTRRHGGTGLGLAIARHLTHKMGGELTVASEVGRGSEFGFTLRMPIVPAPPSGATADSMALRSAAAQSRLRILLAEDNAVNQEVAAAMLRKRGHDVTVVDNGLKAVAAATPGAFDVVLMDIHMPEMDGLAATAAIRQRPGGAGLPIIALTADALAGERERCLAAGMTDYLAKPFHSHELFAIVETRRTLPGAVLVEAVVQPPQASRPPADVDAFRATMRQAGAEDAVEKILDTFVSDAPGRSAALAAAITSGRATDIRAAAHAYKSAAGCIGARSLASILLTVELAGKEGRVDDARALAAGAQSESDAVIAYVRGLRAGALKHV